MNDNAPVQRRAECARCLRALSACACGFAGPVASALELLILQHPMEVRNAKGTARLLHLSLPNSSLVVGESFDAGKLHALLYAGGRSPVLLYPPSSTDACEQVPPGQLVAGATRLVVLDGTWRKSRKMLFCNPVLQALPRLSLADVPPSAYRIRKAHAPHQLSTLEAAACAIAAIDAGADIAPLIDGFDAFINRQAAFAGR
ncbi:MAG TPA: tRNA-uridine aminocarboxypropyltransferase [Telluria sp.]|nr:tRNA-uridine aminocarboxypropyltransferase [Telluria sp.]